MGFLQRASLSGGSCLLPTVHPSATHRMNRGGNALLRPGQKGSRQSKLRNGLPSKLDRSVLRRDTARLSNDADAPVPLNASSATLTSQQNWTGMAGTIKTTDPGVTHPQPCCSYEFVSTSLFAYGNDGDKWLEVGWVESDGFNPTTGSSQQMFTFDKHGGGWQLHYTVTPGNYYSYKIDKCTSEGTVRYCAYTYLSNGTWGLLRTSSATSGCTLSNGCTMNHILVEAQSTDSTPTPTLGGKINFNGFWLLKGTASYQWNTNIGTNATADPVYKPCWGTKWHTGWASKDAC